MELRCRGCAGCCLDWRPLVADAEIGGPDHERRGSYPPLDGTYNLVPLERDEIRAVLDAGLADALTPRLWAAGPDDPHVEVGGHRVAAVAGRPAFFVGLRKPPKPVAPFDRDEASWLPTCVFLDPETLQCRIHEDDLYPAECADYPSHNLALGLESECERVETAFGGERLLSDDVDRDAGERLLLGPQAIGGKVFCHPRPDEIGDAVDRLASEVSSESRRLGRASGEAASGDAAREDRAEFVAVAAASSPGTLAISDHHYEAARERALAASSWVGEAIAEWTRLADAGADADADLAARVEDERGAPPTPGWTAIDDDE
ncbi:YkgJ family cysteine cluster protein [Halovivax sp.]|uniref:YkgJ family cysteine cluster protein n=1 Tax=Halovivax sp. TaxID=1935978 RepID=UPI0025BA9B2B|nr:YkgJ family cysteine cluster protein [Halovivax sp.]